MPFSKGGAYSPYYYDVHLVVRWDNERQTYHGFIGTEHRPLEKPACLEHFFRPGLTWPRRTTSGLSLRAMPRGCIFADKGPAAFVADDAPEALLALCALSNSRAFALLVSVQLAAADAAARSYEVGVIQKTPVPNLTPDQQAALAALARCIWSRKRALDTTEETSHAFLLPAALRTRLGDYNPAAATAELVRSQADIDAISFGLYGFAEADHAAALTGNEAGAAEANGSDDDNDEDGAAVPVETTAGLLSWSAGVAFGRFDIRLATGEREAPPEPEPFDPLPAKSPGMLPDGDPPFHANAGILVDDVGHPHDLPDLIDRVLNRVGLEVAVDTRAWLRREFFPMHLRQYSKSRRKAPIYWPLSTASGSYTLWLYYPALTDQTLYTAANDFVGAKLERQVEPALRALRQKTGRSRDEERELEDLQTLHDELRDLRDELLRLAPAWKPNHDDGVQITAAPLWRLFRHRSWQTVLRDTWEKLEAGDYDWAHLAIVYWPERVREKCQTDKSLAIAHDLEHLYEPPPDAPATAKGGRGRKKKG
ncbi:type II restriction endonuclease subunit M [Roseomonas genomospecies 6]|uniref:Type II restriction endonuclease subunit M n=2 Tax=Roseomonas genomospecies 6 TaxID=214106 RepID=A0A9W7KPX7_9PROT|nr:type II restriction endonuclease subunit M [Roseomonas genomospecies 6]